MTPRGLNFNARTVAARNGRDGCQLSLPAAAGRDTNARKPARVTGLRRRGRGCARAGRAGGAMPAMTPPLGYAIGQLHDIYILAQNAEGLVLVDMHAAHERVLYEQLKAEFSAGRIQCKRLLVAETLSLSESEAAVVESHGELLAEVGFELGRSGPTSALLRGVPALLADRDYLAVARDVIAELDGGPRGADAVRDILDDVLADMGCKAAVKAGRRLTPGRDERPAARHGTYRSGRPLQSWPAELGQRRSRRPGSVVHARPVMVSGQTSGCIHSRPDRVRQDRLGDRPGRVHERRDRVGGFGHGLSRHGYRYGQAGRRDAGTSPACADRYSRPGATPTRRRISYAMPVVEIDRIHAAGRLPLLVGGTSLYFRALEHGLSDMPGRDDALRDRLTGEGHGARLGDAA